jgi:hypothetical protein
MPVEQLDHAGRLAERAHPFFELWLVDWIDEPDATLEDERVRGALDPLVGRPTEPPVPLVKQMPRHAVP